MDGFGRLNLDFKGNVERMEIMWKNKEKCVKKRV